MGEGEKLTRQRIEQLARDIAKKHGFEALGPFGERHGSWEILFHRSSAEPGGLERFVSLAFTAVDGSYDVEFWAGAEDGSRFVRKLVSQSNVGRDQSEVEGLDDILKRGLEGAMGAANRLQMSDLVDIYLSSGKKTYWAGAGS